MRYTLTRLMDKLRGLPPEFVIQAEGKAETISPRPAKGFDGAQFANNSNLPYLAYNVNTGQQAQRLDSLYGVGVLGHTVSGGALPGRYLGKSK